MGGCHPLHPNPLHPVPNIEMLTEMSHKIFPVWTHMPEDWLGSTEPMGLLWHLAGLGLTLVRINPALDIVIAVLLGHSAIASEQQTE